MLFNLHISKLYRNLDRKFKQKINDFLFGQSSSMILVLMRTSGLDIQLWNNEITTSTTLCLINKT